MARARQRRVLYLGSDTGYGGTFFALRALGPEPEVSWCEHEDGCEQHRLEGRHIAINTAIGTPGVGQKDGGVRRDVRLRVVTFGSQPLRDMRLMGMVGVFSWADAIVVVADRRMPFRLRSLVRKVDWLARELVKAGRDVRRIPVVFQLERSDIDPHHSDVSARGASRPMLEQMFTWPGPHAFVETVAYRREGIHEALDKALAMLAELPDRASREPSRHAQISRSEMIRQWTVEREVSDDILERVRELLEMPGPQGLPGLLELWSALRFPSLGRIIVRLSAEHGPHEPVDPDTFDQLASMADPSELPRLLAALARPRTDADAQRIAKLEVFAPDPRITEACRQWLVDFDLRRFGSVMCNGIAPLIVANGDPLSMVDLERHLADHDENIPPPLDHRDWRTRFDAASALDELRSTLGGAIPIAKLPEEDARRWEAAGQTDPLQAVTDLVEAPVVSTDGSLLRCEIRVTNLRRLRELTGDEAWASLEHLSWGSEATRERFIDAGFVLHPVMKSLRSIGGLTIDTLDRLLEHAPLPFEALESRAVARDQFDDPKAWPNLKRLTLPRTTASSMAWLATSPVGAGLVELEVRAPHESVGEWLELVGRGLSALEHLTIDEGKRDLRLTRSGDDWTVDESLELPAELAALLSEAGVVNAEAAREPAPERIIVLEEGEESEEHLDCVAANGELVAAGYRRGDTAGCVVVSDSTSREERWRVELDHRPVAVALTDDGSLAVYDTAGQLLVHGPDGVRSSALDRGFDEESAPRNAAFDRRGTRLANYVDPTRIAIWSVPSGDELARYEADAHERLWLSPDGELLVHTAKNHELVVVRVGDPEPIARLVGHNKRVNHVGFADAESIVTSARDDTIRIWSLDDREPTIIKAGTRPRGFAVSPDQRWLLADADFGLRAISLDGQSTSGHLDDHGIWKAGILLPSGWALLTGKHPWVSWSEDRARAIAPK